MARDSIASTNSASGRCFFLVLLMRLYRALRGCSCGSRGFLEDRMMDMLTSQGECDVRLRKNKRKKKIAGPKI